MISKFEWMIARRYLRGRAEDGFVSATATLSVVGIMLGVAVLIIVMSVMNGFQTTIVNQFLALQGHIRAYPQVQDPRSFKEIRDRIVMVPGIEAARPMIQGQALTVAGEVSSGAMILGIDKEDLERHDISKPGPDKEPRIVAGSLDYFTEGDSIVLGVRLAEKLALDVGDVVLLVSPQMTSTAVGSIPRMRDYQIVALFQLGNYEVDSSTAILPLADARTYFKRKTEADYIEVVLDDPRRAPDIVKELSEHLGRGVYLQDWTELNASWVSALTVERNTMFVILVLIILVAAFNITSSLIMLVKNKSRDIAVLRTMGASRDSIMRIFVACGGVMGVAGCLLGLVLGLVLLEFRKPILATIGSVFGVEFFPPEVYGIDGLPADTQIMEVALTLAIALALSLAMTIYPSRRAANLNPVEALRNE